MLKLRNVFLLMCICASPALAQEIESIRVMGGDDNIFCIKAPGARNAEEVKRLLDVYKSRGRLENMRTLRITSSVIGRPPCRPDEYEAVVVN